MPATSDHDQLATRLVVILRRLNEGDKLDPKALADEFNVHLRTIQRDLTQRFDFLELRKEKGRYHLPSSMLGRFQMADIERFASLAGVKGLFPALSADFLREWLNTRLEDSSLLVRGASFETLEPIRQHLFQRLEHAIRSRHCIDFTYQKGDGPKAYQGLEPYKLINHQGVWYLAAVDDGQMKAFTFSKLQTLDVTEARFDREMTHEQMLLEEDSIWLKAQKTEVVLRVAPEAAHYFQRRKLIGSQRIEKTLESGGLIVSGRVAHANQILPIVRYWIPHVHIISPEGWQEEMEQGLRGYVEGKALTGSTKARLASEHEPAACMQRIGEGVQTPQGPIDR